VKSFFVSHLGTASYGESMSGKGGQCCGDESPSTTSEDTLNEERPSLSGDKS
jgi:hypothetical protein